MRQKTVKRVKTFKIVSTTSLEVPLEVPFELQEMQSPAAGPLRACVWNLEMLSTNQAFCYTLLAS